VLTLRNLFYLLLIFLPVPWPSAVRAATRFWRVDSTRYRDPATYVFLPQVLEGVDIVTLGESIHMTHEFPLVRLGIVRELNEQLGFHTLAFEGSPLDLWATQDCFLSSARRPEDAKAATVGCCASGTIPTTSKSWHMKPQAGQPPCRFT
jgi:erythromycin esterase-like protein